MYFTRCPVEKKKVFGCDIYISKKVGANFSEPEKLALASEGNAQALAEVEAIMLAGTNAAARSDLQRPSMAQDMLKRRRTEIAFMNGFIAEKAAEIGKPAGAHVRLTELVQAIERGEKQPAPDHLMS
jgi:2-dehydropantoate 2-reductase